MIAADEIVSITWMGAIAGIFMLAGVLRWRFSVGARWVSVAICVASIVLSIVSAAVVSYMAVLYRDTVATLKDDRFVQYVTPDYRISVGYGHGVRLPSNESPDPKEARY